MVIFEGKHLNHRWTIGELPGTYYEMSDKGWTDQELFRHWFKNHFLKYAKSGRPLLLLLDGLLGWACQIFNMDESGMSLDPSKVKCIAKQGERNPVAPSLGDKKKNNCCCMC